MLILIRFSGEITTKARGTRLRFLKRLAHNIATALRQASLSFQLDQEHSRFFLETESPQALEILTRVFGVHSFSVVQRRSAHTLEEIVEAGSALAREAVAGKRFAVRAQRAGRTAYSSLEVERALGAALLPYAHRVDLTHPEVTVHVEIRNGDAYFFTEKTLGPGGLPVGASGRALALISGGFDSAVASWLMLKRGVALDYLFCNLGGTLHEQGVLRVVKRLASDWSYGDRPRLYALDFQPLVRELQAKVHKSYWQLLLKRLMYRAAERVAKQHHCTGIVTGEAIGQVSSQTLRNLAVLSQAVRVPLWRPLLGFNKDEIIALARRIGTYEISATVEEYCAILPQRPVTRASLRAVLAEEEKLDLGLLERAFAELKLYDVHRVDPDSLSLPEIEIEEIPEGAVVIDLRSPSAYQAWHYPGAIYMDFFQALREFTKLDRSRVYVLYCELGLKSAHLAEEMRAAGYRAFHFKGGFPKLIRHALARDLVPPELLPPSAWS
ncbi:MAG: tRNA 4-thiouridine(8) synthase ThiI [Candidatus Bipolaricaulota bacterium]|nr:tRNA 4-thiouridine(8) synthase ThiI [Candidatus Bipolaricaulota bacterium]MCS7273871.1 tRNA 4-thiouridine(8) synthase ThiI [Candidatus Bipolaricaulota bacterium]MDW8110711.1 tRNA uracil 4-sulfurtransferase ThiI [Candidatus Bipolaricaulota bacterium]MDW8328431.1 tRNA uracil 4-sulfurtransferase ThiI [Candidatus Bipolaricaulota bacterium]